MADVLETDPKRRDDPDRARLAVETRISYEDFIGFPRAERLGQIIAILRNPGLGHSALNDDMAVYMGRIRMGLEECVYEFDKDQITSAEAYLESQNESLRESRLG